MSTTPAPAGTSPEGVTSAPATPAAKPAVTPRAKAKKPTLPEAAAKPARAAKVKPVAKKALPKSGKAVKANTPSTPPASAPASATAKKAAATWPVPPAKKSKPPTPVAKPKAKLVRDSFTMPQVDFDLIATLKDRALGFKRPTKKSELLRAALQVLAGLSVDALKTALERLAPLKTGRPKKND